MTVEYFLSFWGGAEPAIERELGITKRNHWFATKQERDEFKAKLNKYDHLGLAFYCTEGELTHSRTVAVVTFAYGGRLYTIEDDFGYEYPTDGVFFMFEHGNYACDCNRSAFIQGKYGDVIPELDCGHTIELTGIEIEYRP